MSVPCPERDTAKAAGQKFYQTAKRCKNGHLAPRRVNGNNCTACVRDRQKGKDGVPGQVSVWRAKNPERNLELRKNDRAKIKANPQKHAASQAYQREWKRANYERLKPTIKANTAKRRARIAGVGGQHTAADIDQIRTAQKGRCAYCRKRLTDQNEHVDHIHPIAKGGNNHRRNLQLCCDVCNRAKHADDPIEFAQKTGKLL